MTIEAKLLAAFADVWAQEKSGEPMPELTHETVLLGVGLDSLGFAILLSSFEEAVGYDPFALADEAQFPQTFGALVHFYTKFSPQPCAA